MDKHKPPDEHNSWQNRYMYSREQKCSILIHSAYSRWTFPRGRSHKGGREGGKIGRVLSWVSSSTILYLIPETYHNYIMEDCMIKSKKYISSFLIILLADNYASKIKVIVPQPGFTSVLRVKICLRHYIHCDNKPTIL